MKDPKKVKQGKRNLAKGRRFELKVRKDLEEKGWIVSKWMNNVEFGRRIKYQCYDKNNILTTEEIDIISLNFEKLKIEREQLQKNYKKVFEHAQFDISKLIPAKQGPFRKTSTGFPDFVAYKCIDTQHWNFKGEINPTDEIKFNKKGSEVYEIIGVECKVNGYLKPEEKEKIDWLKSNQIFSKVLVAYKDKNKRGNILYKEV